MSPTNPGIFRVMRLACVLLGSLSMTPAFAITAGQVDDFENGSNQFWREGNQSPNEPENQANGGPLGPGDNYLQNISSGGGNAGGRMVMFNRLQWSGDYVAENVQSIRIWLRNEGNTAMQIRIAFNQGTTWFATTVAFNLPADNQWRETTFELTAGAMTRIQGASDFDTVMNGVTEMRILSSAQPDFRGDAINATLGVDNIEAVAPEPEPELLPSLWSLGNLNGNNKTDLGVFLRDTVSDRNKLFVMDGGSGMQIRAPAFGKETARAATTVSDANGDLVPEFGVLVTGSLFARVKDAANGTLLGEPTFNNNYAPVAVLDVGDVGGGVGPDVAVVGVLPNGNVQAQIKDVASGSPVNIMGFSKSFVPFDAVVTDNVGGGPSKEIAVLGINASGSVRAQVKDSLTGQQVSIVRFNANFTPLKFAAVPNGAGNLVFLAVLGRNGAGALKVQIKRANNGTLVNTVAFRKNFDPIALLSFVDSNGSGGGEIGVVGVNNAGKVRSEFKEIDDGSAVNAFRFHSGFPPHDAIAINGVAGTGRNEVAVLGESPLGQLRIQVRDLLNGNNVKNILVP